MPRLSIDIKFTDCRMNKDAHGIDICIENNTIELSDNGAIKMMHRLMEAYPDDLHKRNTPKAPVEEKVKTVPDLLESAAQTYRERNAIYGDNYKNVGKVMMAMFPAGIELKTEEAFNKWHLFELMVVKMTRFANSNLGHQDSIHDLGVYSFMVQGEIK